MKSENPCPVCGGHEWNCYSIDIYDDCYFVYESEDFPEYQPRFCMVDDPYKVTFDPFVDVCKTCEIIISSNIIGE